MFNIRNLVIWGSRVLLGSLLFLSLCWAQVQLTYSDKENPHGSDDCLACHTAGSEASKTNVIPNLCETCHSAAGIDALIHPMYDLNHESPEISYPTDWPLTDAGHMTCMSCHQINHKTDRANRSFLRGGPYRRDLDFCFACHKTQNFTKTNPHKQILANGEIDNSACLHCHSKQPTADDHPTIAREMHLDMTATCNKCHSLHTHQQNHQGLDIRKSKKATLSRYRRTQRETKVTLPLEEDRRIQCNTCHYTHQRGTLAADQVIYEGAGENVDYLRLPKEKLCYACHNL